MITGEYTDEKGGQVVAVDYSKGYDKGKAVAEYFLEGDVSDVRVSSKGLIAASVFDRDTREGKVQFFKYNSKKGLVSAGSVEVGYQPDQLTFSKDGKTLVTADEGEPLMFYGSDEIDQNPKGSVSIINVNSKKPGKSKVKTLYFDKPDSYYTDRGVRLYNPEKVVGEKNVALRDIEPEYVGIIDNKTALVALQENNALAEVDFKKGLSLIHI